MVNGVEEAVAVLVFGEVLGAEALFARLACFQL